MELRHHSFRWLLFLNVLFSIGNLYSASAPLQSSAQVSTWKDGGQVIITVTNNTSTAISNWTAEFDLVGQMTDFWNAEKTVSEKNHVTVKNPKWFQSLVPNTSATFGFVVSGNVAVNNLKAYTGSAPTDPTTTKPVNLQATYQAICDWTSGYQAQVAVKNTHTEAINNWTIEFDLPTGQTVIDIYNATYTVTNNHVIAKSLTGTTAVNATQTVVFVIKGSGSREFNNLKATSLVTVPTDPTDPTDPTGPTSGYKFVGYFPNWFIYSKPHIQEFPASAIRGDLLTHVNYAFAKPYTTDANRNVTSYKVSLFDPYSDVQYQGSGNFGQLIQLKKQYPNLKTLIAIGGWTVLNEGFPAAKFSVMAASAATRKEFIDSLVDLIITYEFDGADIDWEYPAFEPNGGKPADTKNFTQLMKELNAAFKNEQALATLYAQKGKTAKKSLLLTMAGPAGYQNIKNMELSIIKDYVDWFNLMTYDFHGSWDTATNHNSPLNAPSQGDPLFNVKSAVNQYLQAGVPANKIILGMPLYGRSFASVQSNTDGLFAPFNGPGEGTDPNEPGMLLYYDIHDRLLSSYTRYFDSQAQVPYLFSNSTKQFITYDDEQSLALKSQYVKDTKLGGAMFWSLAKEDSQWGLISKVNADLATA